MTAEHLHPDDQHPVHITINGKKVVAPDDELTGRQIKELGGVNPSNRLFREINEEGDDQPITDEQIVELHPEDEFYDMPPGNFG